MYKSFNSVNENKPNETGKPNVIDVKPADSSNEKPPLEVGNVFHHSIGGGGVEGGGTTSVLRQKHFVQESPSAWTQKVYRLSCSKSWRRGYLPWRGGGVPTLAGGYILWLAGTYLGQGGYLPWPRGVSTLAGGYLPWLEGYLPWAWRVPTLAWMVPTLARMGYPPPPGVDRLKT